MDDAHLVERARGDESAFAELVSRYGDRVYRVCLGILGHREGAEDAAQETFLRLYRSLESYDPARKFSSWLFRAAANAAIDMARTRKRERDMIASQEIRRRRPSARAGAGDPEVDELRTRLGELPVDYRSVLTLRFSEGMSCADIAEALGKTPNAVSVAIYKAKKMLLERMGG